MSIHGLNNNNFDPENPIINDDISVSSVPSYKPKSPDPQPKKKEEDLPTYEQFTKNVQLNSNKF